jgi:GWxTD domain-containing protein
MLGAALLLYASLVAPAAERATVPVFQGKGAGALTLLSLPEKVSLDFYLVQCIQAAPDGGTFLVSRSEGKAGTVAVGQIFTDPASGLSLRIDDGEVDFSVGDAWSFATFPRREELDRLFNRWVDQYVKWIISREERELFHQLRSAEEKIVFIEGFWRRRDPNPETPANERREEHQRRFAYAVQHFGAGIPGWATDRGKIYILLGPPHGIQRNPAGRTAFERPSEVWTYNNPPNPRLPASMDIGFVDFTATGRYEIVSATNLDILAPLRTNIGYAMSELEAIGLLRSGGEIMDQTTGLRTSVDPTRMVTQQFDFQRDLMEIDKIPERRLSPLRSSIEATTAFPSLPLSVRAAYFPTGTANALTPVTLSLPYARLTPERSEGGFRYRASVLVQVRRLPEDPGATPETLEDRLEVSVPADQLAAYRENTLLYEGALALTPGRYQVEAFLRDEPSGALGKGTSELEIPELDSAEGLVLSSLLLASGAVEVPAADSAGPRLPFQFGNLRLLPSPDGRFAAGSKLIAYFQAGGYRADPDGGGARLRVEFFFLREGRLYSKVAPSEHRPQSKSQTAIKSEISLKGFPPGSYRLRARVTDGSGAVAEQEAQFVVKTPAGG